jgi:hypothetical protein
MIRGVLLGSEGAIPIQSDVHYHILWSNSTLDWKPFATKEDAQEIAEAINKRNESYTVVDRGADCERCKAFREQRAQTQN